MIRSPTATAPSLTAAPRAGAAARLAARRRRASTSAGLAVSRMTSDRPQSLETATRPPSVTTASKGAESPVVRSSRARPRAPARSRRASRSTASTAGASSNAEGSGEATRTSCGKRDMPGRTSAAPPGDAVKIRTTAMGILVIRRSNRGGASSTRCDVRIDDVMRTSSRVTSLISLTSADGVRLTAVHIPARRPSEIAIVLIPGFSGWSQKPGVARASAVLAEFGDVLQVDLRGHGRSSGVSTLADREVLDIDAAVAYARTLGFPHVITVGFSMGGAAAMRHAGLAGEDLYGHRVQHPPDALVCVSTGSVWYQRDTRPMRRLHWLVLTRLGRLVARRAFQVRIDPAGWGFEPISPLDAARRIRVPLLLVQ